MNNILARQSIIISNSMKYHFQVLLCFLLPVLLLADCPFTKNPSDSYIGQISADLNNPNLLAVFQQTYTYTYNNSYSESLPKIAIGLVGMQYQSTGPVSFQIVHLLTPSLVTIAFSISVTNSQIAYNNFVFNFFLTTNPYFDINNLVYQVQSSSLTKITANYPLNPNIVTPKIELYLSGLILNTKTTRLAQINFGIRLPTYSGGNLSFGLNYDTTNFNVSSISVSTIIYDAKGVLTSDELLDYSGTLTTANKYSVNLAGLSYTDFTFYGINQFVLNLLQPNSFLLQYTPNSTNNLNFAMVNLLGTPTFTFQVLQLKTAENVLCQNCVGYPIIYQQSVCVAACPNGYATVLTKGVPYCVLCSLNQFLVPNSNGTQCVCPLQYFMNTTTSQCQACHYSCYTCSDSQTCLYCDSITQRITNRVQLPTLLCGCAQGYYDDNSSLICLACHSDCKTCNGPLSTNCIVCQTGMQKNTFNQCICLNGFIYANSACVCPSPYMTVNGQCINLQSSCDANQVASTNLTLTSQKIVGAKGVVCQCISGYYMVQGNCVQCAPNQYYDNTQGICVCLVGYNSVNGVCQAPNVNQVYNPATSSYVCIAGYQFNTQTNICVQCPPRQILLNNVCTCVFGYTLDTSVNICVQTQPTDSNLLIV